jgi:hypothetical protein
MRAGTTKTGMFRIAVSLLVGWFLCAAVRMWSENGIFTCCNQAFVLATMGEATKTDCYLQVVRCFEDENVIHVAGKVDPVEDIDVINFELALADITQIEKRLERIAKGRAKTKEETTSNEVSQRSFGATCMQSRSSEKTCFLCGET